MQEEEKKDVSQEQPNVISTTASPTRTRLIIVIIGGFVILLAFFLLLHENTKSQDIRSRAQEEIKGKSEKKQEDESVSTEIVNPVTEEQSAEVQVKSPKANEVLTVPLKLEAEIGDLTVSSVQFWLDNDSEPSYTVTTPPLTIEIQDLRPGTHTVVAKAVLSDGNVKTSQEVSFRLTPSNASMKEEGGHE